MNLDTLSVTKEGAVRFVEIAACWATSGNGSIFWSQRQRGFGMITLTINGEPRDVDVPAEMPPLWFLKLPSGTAHP